MNVASTAVALVAALIARAGAAEHRAAADVVRVADRTASFPSGPYVALAVDPHDSTRLALTTADGRVAWTDDDGDTVDEALVVAPREYLSAPLRTRPSLLTLTSQRSGSRLQLSGLVGERPGMRLFLWLLKERRPVARWQYWMAIENPATDIADVTVPARGRPMLAATASGLFLSDPRHAGWIAVAGAPAPRAATLTVLAVTVDPEDPAHVLAGTPGGPLISHDGGRTFAPHPSADLEEVAFRRFYWDPETAGHLLAIASGAVYQSHDAGASFERAFATRDGVNAVALGDGGAYVATGRGLIAPGRGQRLLADEPVVGVVPLSDGGCLAASETTIYVAPPDGTPYAVARAPGNDPFLRLDGDGDVAWAITRHAVYRVSRDELPRRPRVDHPPHMQLSAVSVEHSVVAHLGIGDPAATRLGKPWVAALIPRVTVTARSLRSHEYSSLVDALLPFPERLRTAASASACCGAYVAGDGTPELLVMATWDVGAIIAATRAPSYPYAIIEMNLRAMREQILPEVRWRYRAAAELAARLARPPRDPWLSFLWQTQLDEHAAYLEAMAGRTVVTTGSIESSNPFEE